MASQAARDILKAVQDTLKDAQDTLRAARDIRKVTRDTQEAARDWKEANMAERSPGQPLGQRLSQGHLVQVDYRCGS
ncbi:hypothetical protein AARAC_000647 [Aspergillus arachidicola]|uniref:Uncharacterized protein n=1 Tax=Aspergillus arachidicola TaxID=656916 RepID=A0A2G7FWY5_9EURO|nr:hypothetical protein AARAC_000647 [Aspergillus arachidicola]